MDALRRRIRLVTGHAWSESGQSLVLAMVIMSALTISIGAVISFTTSNETQFGRDRQAARAFHVAEAGVNDGIAVIAKNDSSNSLATSSRLPASGTYPITLDGASGTYYMQKYAAGSSQCTSVSLSSSTPCWIVYGTATSPNGKVVRAIQETIKWKTQTEDESSLYDYGLVVFNQGGSCVNTFGTVNLTIQKVWIGGDFCPKGNVSLMPPADNTGLVYIGGQFQGTNNTSIGSSSLRYASADIVGGCSVQGKTQICSDSANSNVWAVSTPSVDPSTLQKPDINASSVYAEGNWSSPTCSTGSFTFDSDSTMNGTTPTTTLMPSTASFNCTVKDSSGNVVGQLTWDNSTKAMTISGTIWIDGNVNFSNSGTYTGNGTIYVNGVVGGASNITVCGPANTTPSGYGCPGTWQPTSGELGIVVVNPSNVGTAFSRTGNGELDILVFVNQGYANTGGTAVMGPVVADSATMGGNSGLLVPAAPPSGFPTTVTSSAAWVVQPGSWKQTQ